MEFILYEIRVEKGKVVTIHIMKQLNNKKIMKKRTARFRKNVSIIGGSIGLVTVIYKILSYRKKSKPLHSEVYIPISQHSIINEVLATEEVAATYETVQANEQSNMNEEYKNKPLTEQLLLDVLQNELHLAKNVWVTNLQQEEIQLNKRIFEEAGHLYLGNNEKNIKLQDVCKLKYRNKVYFDNYQ